MLSCFAVVILLTLAGKSALADSPLAFVEDVRGPQRIVSGWESEIGQHSHQLSLRMVDSVGTVMACGGSIIHEEWALTAAHCTALRITIVIRAGVVSLSRPEVIIESTEWYNHPLYIDLVPSIVQRHDISLLKLQRPLTFSATIKPIRVQRAADMDKNYQGIRLVASGWGTTWTGGSSPENMNWVYLFGDSNEACRRVYGGSLIIADSTICASVYNVSSQSTCQGDSGGPLSVVDADDEVTLVGVASFVSSTGCHTGYPAGFIRPGHYHDWYKQVTGISFDWQPKPDSNESSDSSSSSCETNSSSSESKSSSCESHSSSSGSKSSSCESKSSSSESKSSSCESNSSSSESNSSSSESKSSSSESNSSYSKSSSSSSESSSSSSESKSSSSESSPSSSESNSSSSESNSSSSESNSSSSESK